MLLPPALATGRLTIVTGAMAREVTTDDEGLATGVSYVDTATGQDRHARARVVVLAASACESAPHPAQLALDRDTRTALANSSGGVGRYLTDTVGTSACAGFVPALADLPPHNEDGVGGHARLHPVVARQPEARLPARLPRRARRRAAACPATASAAASRRCTAAATARQLKDDYRRYYGAFVGFSGRGEMPARTRKLLRDRPGGRGPLGHPRAALPLEVVGATSATRRGTCSGPSARSSRRWAARSLSDRSRPRGTQADRTASRPAARSSTRSARRAWATSPRTSVLNEWCQAHDCRNLFVADGGPFVSNPHKNATWTILALAMRTAEHIADERREGEPVKDEAGGPGASLPVPVVAELVPIEPAVLPINRRELLRRAGTVTVAAGFALSSAALEAAHEHVAKQKAAAAAKQPAPPRFFDPSEWSTVRTLRDLVIPADERSGSASEALVPEFIDYVLTDPLSDPRERETSADAGAGRSRLAGPRVRGPLRTRLRRLRRRREEERSRRRSPGPSSVGPGMEAGAGFFTLFRDLVASGYWTSRVGTEDLRYLGNTYVAEWKGCPPEVLSRLGLGER